MSSDSVWAGGKAKPSGGGVGAFPERHDSGAQLGLSLMGSCDTDRCSSLLEAAAFAKYAL